MPRKHQRSARFAAVLTLCRLYRQRLPLKPLLDRAVVEMGLPGIERSLAMQLVYGVLRHRQQLDRITQLLSRTPLRKLDPTVHQTLAVGLYQLFFLERIPPSAAVNEAVECCKAAGLPQRLSGFVNGILRQAIREKETLAAAALRDAAGREILNHPEWLVARWRSHFGEEESRRICRANNHEPLLVLRTNTARIGPEELRRLLSAQGVANLPGNYAEETVVLPQHQGPVTELPGYAEGYFQVQDQAAQLATRLLAPFRRCAAYLDACAGLGGKTSHLLQLAARHDFQVHAVEPEPHRRKKLQENLTRLFPDIHPVIHEKTLQQAAEELSSFAGILVDAPCSGTGVTGRHPDIRWNRRPEDLARYRQEQLTLLACAARLLAPGGIMVYATCSIEPEENIEVVREFLGSWRSFDLTDCSAYLPEQARRFIVDGCFAPRPEAGMDGFFAARMTMEG